MPDKREITNENIYDLLKTVSTQNAEIKSNIDSIVNHIAVQDAKISDIQKENLDLKVECNILRRRVTVLEKQARENNLVFYNLEETNTASLLDIIIELIANLGVPLEPVDIVNLYRIGKKTDNNQTKRPVLLKLSSHLKKVEILKNLKKLKGTGIAAAEDLTREERAIHKVVYSHYREAKIKGYQARLLGTKVVINGVVYEYKDLVGENIEQVEEGESLENVRKQQRKSRSTPASPTADGVLGIDSINADGVLGINSINSITDQSTKDLGPAGKRGNDTALKSQTSVKQGTVPKQKAIETRSRSGSKSSVSSLGESDGKRDTKKKS